jgi:hypothetical protein
LIRIDLEIFLSFQEKFWAAGVFLKRITDVNGNSLAYLADHPEALNAAISGSMTPEEIAKKIFDYYGRILPLNFNSIS